MKSFRRSLRVLVSLLCASYGATICEAQTPPTRILPLGDSLTSGTTVQGAYRNRLYSLLTSAGYNVDFVGTQTDTSNPTLPDRDHQGMGGYRIDQIQTGLSSWLNVIEDPDVILLMIGTNDFSQNFNVATAQTRLANLVTDVATKRPFSKIILSNLPLRTDSPTLESQQSAFNAAIPGIVSDQVALGRQVTFLDMHSALLPGDFAEGVHPTPAGYDKMADAWLPRITSVITPLGTANPPAIVRTEPPVDLQHITVRFSKPLADSAAALANFSLNGGLTISQAVLDVATKRTITLTTSSQAPGKLYTLTVSGVRDRTPAQTLIAAGSAINYSSFTLANGSFELGETGWTMTGNRLNYASDGSYVATNGSKMMVLNGGNTLPNAIMSQTFTTVPGQYYVLNYDVGVLSVNTASQQLGVSVIGANTLLARIETMVGDGLGVSVWSTKSYSFVADGTLATLNFQDQSASSSGIDLLLDNVRITATPAPVNTAPVAVADSYTTTQGVALAIPAAGVLANDTDAESNALTAVLNAGPSHGTLVLNANGSFTYTPAAGYTGPDSFTYQANDGGLNSNIATASITVNAVAVGSLVNGSFENGEAGWTMTGNRLVYQSDGTYVATEPLPTATAHMLVLNGGPAVPNAVIKQVFATTPGQPYILSFDMGALAISTAEQRLQVSLVNANSSMTQEEIDFLIHHAGSTTDSLLLQDASVFGNGLGTSAWTPKSYSFVAVSNLTSLAFTDISTATSGIDMLLDNVKITAAGTLPNTAPVAVADSYSTNQNIALVIPAAGVLANDTDAQSNPLTAVLNVVPSHGVVTLNANGSFTYTPASGYAGTDSFTYHANDGNLDSNIVAVSLTVNAVNTAPVAVADSYSTNQNAALVVPAAGVLANDTDAQSNPLTAILNVGPGHGTLSLNANGGFTYTPTAGYSGADSFTYHANDGLLNSNIVAVNITVNVVNTAPVAVADSYATNQDTALVVPAAGVLSNDTDAQSNPLTAILNAGPSHGTLTLNANGGFTYTPAAAYTGADSFTYHANDGSLNSNVVTVGITVSAANSQILVNGSFESNYTGWTTSGNQTLEAAPPYEATDGTTQVAFNSHDLAPSGSLSQNFATVAGQTYTLTFDMGVLSYIKKQQKLTVSVTGTKTLLSQTISLKGDDQGDVEWVSKSFTFVANSATSVLSFRDRSSFTNGLDLLLDNVRVTGPAAVPSALPVAVADLYSVNRNTTLVVPAAGILANDIAPQTNAPSALLDAGPGHGSLTLNANGGFTYTPNTGYTGGDSFTYHARDGGFNSNTVTVSIVVNENVTGILANPSFESNFTGWTTSGNQSIEFYPASDGIKMVAFNGQNQTANAVLSQTFATTPGQTYSLVFDASVLAYTTDSQALQVSVTGSGSLLSQTINLSGTGTGLGPWLAQSFTFMANGTSTTLAFRDVSTATFGIDLLLDNVRVVAIAAPVAAGLPAANLEIPSLAKSTASLTSTPESFIISMIAPQEGDYVLERSEDLKTWEAVDSMECGGHELIKFYDTREAFGTKGTKKQMFYRIGLQPEVTN